MLEIRFDGLIVCFTNFENRAQIGLYEYINIYLRNTVIIVKTHSENSTSPSSSSFLRPLTKDKSYPLSILQGRSVFRDTRTFAGVWILWTPSSMFWKIWIFSIVFFVVVASTIGDASLYSVGDMEIEASHLKFEDIRPGSGSQTSSI